MTTLIQELMKNKTVHGELSDEAKKCFDEVGKRNCETRMDDGWKEPAPPYGDPFYNSCTYRIKRDYQPEPEVEWCKLTQTSNGRYRFDYDDDWHFIDFAVNIVNFAGYKYADGTIDILPRRFPDGVVVPAEHPVAVGFVKEQ